MGLEKTNFPISEETVGGVEICVTVYSSSVNCPIEFPFAVTLTAEDGTAGMYVVNVWCMCILMKLCILSFSVAPMDYKQNTPVTLEFKMCDMTLCHCIPIEDDDISESNEMFYVTLEGTADMDRDKIRLEPVKGRIEIIDNDT